MRTADLRGSFAGIAKLLIRKLGMAMDIKAPFDDLRSYADAGPTESVGCVRPAPSK